MRLSILSIGITGVLLGIALRGKPATAYKPPHRMVANHTTSWMKTLEKGETVPAREAQWIANSKQKFPYFYPIDVFFDSPIVDRLPAYQRGKLAPVPGCLIQLDAKFRLGGNVAQDLWAYTLYDYICTLPPDERILLRVTNRGRGPADNTLRLCQIDPWVCNIRGRHPKVDAISSLPRAKPFRKDPRAIPDLVNLFDAMPARYSLGHLWGLESYWLEPKWRSVVHAQRDKLVALKAQQNNEVKKIALTSFLLGLGVEQPLTDSQFILRQCYRSGYTCLKFFRSSFVADRSSERSHLLYMMQGYWSQEFQQEQYLTLFRTILKDPQHPAIRPDDILDFYLYHFLKNRSENNPLQPRVIEALMAMGERLQTHAKRLIIVQQSGPNSKDWPGYANLVQETQDILCAAYGVKQAQKHILQEDNQPHRLDCG